MKKIICTSILLLNSILLLSQDYSFSQFDLNMLYSNPAFAGYKDHNRVLLHRKNQWVGIAEKFNSNILELNLSGELNGSGFSRGRISWAGGIYIIEDHENSVFKKYNIGIIPWTFHFQLPKRFFISMGIQNVISYNSLDWDKLIFSDEINALGLTGEQTSASIPAYDKYTNWFDPSFGFIITKQSLLKGRNDQTTSIGMATHHLSRVVESFYNNQVESSKLPVKYTIHAEHISSIPSFMSQTFKLWKIFARHEQQAKFMQKDELGFSTTLANNLHLEFGTIYRIGRYNTISNNQIMSESIIPLMRMRLKPRRNIGMEISYSYDFNISKLQNINTIATNEINLNFYFLKKRPKICPAVDNWVN